MRIILSNISKEDRAGVLSTVFLISYSGAALPNMIVGQLAGTADIFNIAVGYGVLVLVCCILLIITTSKNMH